MNHQIEYHLDELEDLLTQYDDHHFCNQCENLNISIGKHVRHIIECFSLLIEGYNDGVVYYDRRERNVKIEQETEYAIERIQFLKNSFRKEDKLLQVEFEEQNYSSSYFRELHYQMEHIIHHKAIIKPLLERHEIVKIHNEFGFAPATIKYNAK